MFIFTLEATHLEVASTWVIEVGECRLLPPEKNGERP